MVSAAKSLWTVWAGMGHVGEVGNEWFELEVRFALVSASWDDTVLIEYDSAKDSTRLITALAAFDVSDLAHVQRFCNSRAAKLTMQSTRLREISQDQAVLSSPAN